MQVGTISKLIHDREYGKIKTNSGEDAHFHKGCLWDTPFIELTEGQEVDFEIQDAHKGCLAFHVRPHMKNVFLETYG